MVNSDLDIDHLSLAEKNKIRNETCVILNFKKIQLCS